MFVGGVTSVYFQFLLFLFCLTCLPGLVVIVKTSLVGESVVAEVAAGTN